MSMVCRFSLLKFTFSRKATTINEAVIVELTLCSKCQIDGEDFVNFVAFLENTNFNNKGIHSPISTRVVNIGQNLVNIAKNDP